jgi:DNA polymerase I-like protein with 3'-5' exonuclease and polymerase domains
MGKAGAPIMVVVDPAIVHNENETVTAPLSRKQLNALAPFMKEAGLKSSDMFFVSACKPVTQEVWDSDSKLGKVIKDGHDHFLTIWNKLKPKIIVPMGKAAARQVFNRSVKITKIRGIGVEHEALNVPVFPMLGINHILRVPEHGDLFNADIQILSRIVNAGYSLDADRRHVTRSEWCTDLQPVLDLLAQRGRLDIGLDTESSAFKDGQFPHWYLPETKVLTVQITHTSGHALVVPIDFPQYPIPRFVRNRIVRQLKQLLEDPRVFCTGQNMKHDFVTLLRKLSIRIRNYDHDTVLMVQCVNENMLSKTLEDITKVYFPAAGGHKDRFLSKGYRYDRMDLVPADDMLDYAGPDADAVFNLRDELSRSIKEDKKLWNCYRRVMMPAMRAFCDVEQRGFKINKEALEVLRRKVAAKQKIEGQKLLAKIPAPIRTKWAETGVGLYIQDDGGVRGLTREGLIRDLLFENPRGFRFQPRVFTKSKKASTSAKLHLPYFATNQWVADYIKYTKNEHLLNSFIGVNDPEAPTGFWQYIYDDLIRPSYLLHGTVTGRTSSRDPNGQNFPKRGEFAKEYRAIFEAPDDWVLIEADYSQIELRVAGWLANEETFLEIYRTGGDIHCMTAAVTMGITLQEFMEFKKTDPDKFDLNRYRAKAVNFGFIYGMGWRKFMVYAKTEYGIDYTEDEAQRIREAFFGRYKGLTAWHKSVRNWVKQNGYVRALDGRVRHLPAVTVDDEGISSSAERQAVNSPVQAFASDMGIMALARINSELPTDFIRVVGFVHDALICVARKGREVEAARAVKRYMETNPLKQWFGLTPPLPIISDIKIGLNLSKLIELRQEWIDDPKITTLEQVKKLDDERSAKNKKQAKPVPRRIIRPLKRAA